MMRSKREILTGLSMLLGLFFLAVVGILSYRSTHRLTDSRKWVSHTLEVIGDLRRVNSDLIEARDSQRGYALFHVESELARAHESMARIPIEIGEIRQLTGDNPRQQARLDRLDVLVSRRLTLIRDALSLATTRAGEESRQQAIYDQAKAVSSESDQLLAEVEAEERLLLVDREQRAATETRITSLVIGAGFLLALLLVTGAGVLGQWEIARRHRSEDALSAARDHLASNLKDAEERGRERNTLSELAGRLQSCRNPAEGLPFMSRGMQQLFPGESGCIFLTSASRNILESAINWGNHAATESSFPPEDCWALRQGRLQIVDATDPVLRCPHLHPEAGRDAVCVPLVGQGETLGVICHYSSSLDQPVLRSEISSLNRIRMATLAGAQISLAVANLQLRETLRNQSIRDVLTGLFNRRYMEESLARECHRAFRRKSSLAVMMVDIDQFKQFNDTFGHEVGDRLLREFGRFLAANIRGEDIACRYGGEEFTLILPEAGIEGAAKRADALRQGTTELSIPLKDGSAATITISIGVALYPENATTPETLLRAADTALYLAKAEGRDRFVVSHSQVLA
jgi:diguanylate cyclase (GGDEF)-like protein